MVQVIVLQDDSRRLLDRLRVSFAGTRLVYWAMPVTDFGIID